MIYRSSLARNDNSVTFTLLIRPIRTEERAAAGHDSLIVFTRGNTQEYYSKLLEIMKNSRLLFLILMTLLCRGNLTASQNTVAGPLLSGIELGYNKSDLEYVKCFLSETFDPEKPDYSAVVDRSFVSRIFITPYADCSDDLKNITVNGAFARPGEKFPVTLNDGENRITITLIPEEGASMIYNIMITRKDLSAEYVSELVAEGVWRISDFGGFPGNEDMYLVEGKKKAVLFDAGFAGGDLAGFVRKLTSKPVEVAITHGHGDHTKQVGQFPGSRVYMSEKDRGMLPKELNTSEFVWVKEGDVIDLGDRSFEVMELPTHSPGSLVFLDPVNQLAVTGDALGSGSMVWAFMVPFKELNIYAGALRKIESRISSLKGLTLLVGHHYQEQVPLTGLNGKQIFTDMRILTEDVLSGKKIGEMASMTFGTRTVELRQAYYGLAGLWYSPK